MSNARQDFVMSAGKAVTVNFSVPGADLTSGTLTWRIAKSPGGVKVVSKTNGSGIGTITGTSCVLTIADGDIVDPGLYWHNLEQTIAGVTTPLLEGRVIVRYLPTAT